MSVLVCGFTLAGDTMLAWGEEHKQGELGADEALAGAWCAGHDQVGHGVGCGVNPSQTAAAAATRPTRTGLKSVTRKTKQN